MMFDRAGGSCESAGVDSPGDGFCFFLVCSLASCNSPPQVFSVSFAAIVSVDLSFSVSLIESLLLLSEDDEGSGEELEES